jgi:hypothetical protein
VPGCWTNPRGSTPLKAHQKAQATAEKYDALNL